MRYVNIWSVLEKYGSDDHNINIKKEKDNLVVKVYRKMGFRLFGYEITKQVLETEFIIKIDNKKREGLLDSVIDPAYENDTNIDCSQYMRYAEKGFNENKINILNALEGVQIPDDSKIKLEEFNYRLDLLHCAVGLADEVGEILDHIKKYVYHNRPLDKIKIISEFGDEAWYKFNMLRLLEISFYDVLKSNKIKLDKRYPHGRGDKNYMRDVDAEDKAIEEGLGKGG